MPQRSKPDSDGETQTTEQGYEIPVPTKDDVFEGLRKVAPPVTPSDDDAGSAEK